MMTHDTILTCNTLTNNQHLKVLHGLEIKVYFQNEKNDTVIILRYIACVSIYFSQSIAFSNIYLFSILFSKDFARWKSVGLPHFAYSVIH